MKRRPIFLIMLSLCLAACATPQSPDPASPVQEVEPRVEVSPERAATDPDLMYHVLAGEITGADGDTANAAYQYLEAAMESDDPAVAARATRIALAAQEWQYAAMAADRWAFLQPDNIDARQTAARALMVVGDYVGTEHQLKAMIESMSHDPGRAWALSSELLSAAANPEKARQVMERLTFAFGGDANGDALFAQSILLGRQGDIPEAISTAERALRVDPDRANIHAWAGRLAVNVGQDAEALDHYHAAWQLQPEDRRIAMAYAELLRRNEESQQAQQVLASLRDTPETRFARIAFALDSDDRELAERLFQGFEDADYPDAGERAFQAAQAAELLEMPNDAMDWYARVDDGERLLVATLRRAFLIAEHGDLAAARALLSALRRDGDPSFREDSLIAESEILTNADRKQEAFDLLSEAIGEHHPEPGLLYSRAILAVQLDRLDIAEQDLRRIIEEDPQNATALNALGYTLADLTDRFDEAERLIRAAYALQPDEASIIDSMGWVAYRQGRLDEAEHYLRDAWARDRNAEIGAHLGEVLWKAGDTAGARAIWDEALESDPNNSALRETLDRFVDSP